MVNIKPSRFGTLRGLFEMYDWCEREGVQAPTAAARPSSARGAAQIQYLASLFHPDTPNDTAPSGYNEPELRRRPAPAARSSRASRRPAFAGAGLDMTDSNPRTPG